MLVPDQMESNERAGDIDLRGTRELFTLSNAAARRGGITTPVTL